mmetsp:Transcript_17284/g.37313  ORF Transcript_17284/g.37313 Transcript_17284/m.37313 type:complete len:160 (-) Transcript_17284:154-633(-)
MRRRCCLRGTILELAFGGSAGRFFPDEVLALLPAAGPLFPPPPNSFGGGGRGLPGGPRGGGGRLLLTLFLPAGGGGGGGGLLLVIGALGLGGGGRTMVVVDAMGILLVAVILASLFLNEFDNHGVKRIRSQCGKDINGTEWKLFFQMTWGYQEMGAELH